LFGKEANGKKGGGDNPASKDELGVGGRGGRPRTTLKMVVKREFHGMTAERERKSKLDTSKKNCPQKERELVGVSYRTKLL